MKGISNLFKLFSSIFGSIGRPKVVTRFAPSPTGFLHAGNYRTAVFSYLYARQNGGKFVLRIEDTDRARSKKEYEDNIIESLTWLGLEYDDKCRQSDRTAIYESELKKLIAADKAYISKEPSREDPTKTVELIRFRNPRKKVSFVDMIRGKIEFDTTELGDFVIARNMKEPVFHLVVVIDDYLSGITHVVRGEDHIPNTPRHILIQEAIGAPHPVYAHLPLVLAPDRSKLSKRHGAQPITYYRDQGYLPEAVLNYMCLLGWNPGTDQEIFTKAGLVKAFNLSKVQKGGAIFNEEKLRWVNKEHLKLVPQKEFTKKLEESILKNINTDGESWKIEKDTLERLSSVVFPRLAPIIHERVETYKDIDKLIITGELDYYFADPTFDDSYAKNTTPTKSLAWKGGSLDDSKKHLEKVRELMSAHPDNAGASKWTKEDDIKSAVWPYADANGRGNVLWPLRIALSGKDKSPNPFALAMILGKETTLRRIDNAINAISKL